MAEKIQIMGSTPGEEETGRDLPVLRWAWALHGLAAWQEPLYGLTYLPRKFKALTCSDSEF